MDKIKGQLAEYGVCTCEGCKCDKSVDKTYENEVEKSNGG